MLLTTSLTFAPAERLYPCGNASSEVATSGNHVNLSRSRHLAQFRPVTHAHYTSALYWYPSQQVADCLPSCVSAAFSAPVTQASTRPKVSLLRLCLIGQQSPFSLRQDPTPHQQRRGSAHGQRASCDLVGNRKWGRLIDIWAFLSGCEAKGWRNGWNKCFLSGSSWLTANRCCEDNGVKKKKQRF